MQLTTNSALVWKRRADESEQAAKMQTRISILLMILMFVTGAVAHSSRNRVADICSDLLASSNATESAAARKLASDAFNAHCS
ncbi:hypothetical protein [Aestuariivirga sp.]|uniref:hypothetical protein n=1 Tax=Aestuariivirga sp. TaxID=2650926 RepID=UPI003593DC6B